MQRTSASRRGVVGCSAEDGWNLTRRGGTPVDPFRVVGGTYEFVLQGGAWKLDRTVAAPEVPCAGLTLQDFS